MNDTIFSITAASESPSKTKINVRQFEFFIDEPVSLGGTDTAPNPVEVLLGAYAGCINVMCFVIAREMGFELKSVHMALEGTLNPDRLYGKSFAQRAGFKEIHVKLMPDTQADPNTLDKWLASIKERCPVGDNIGNMTPITVTLG